MYLFNQSIKYPDFLSLFKFMMEFVFNTYFYLISYFILDLKKVLLVLSLIVFKVRRVDHYDLLQEKSKELHWSNFCIISLNSLLAKLMGVLGERLGVLFEEGTFFVKPCVTM